ncbi:uncharacterized protein LOC130713474 [Lotus japonicus]|uniref:uncharacterized protein LOC130713474 n=1 Tax=Lotus japonicus TaxID=34305 RepID=UPI00258756E9|nr:uncharacterized protein LOC130713474 [Lotus japonicus]
MVRNAQINNNNGNQQAHVVQDPAQNPISPYYIHSGENPSATMVSPPLNGRNYSAWARSMKRALVAKNKFKFINGEIPVAVPGDANYDAWDRCNSLIHSWILNSVTSTIANSIVFVENACDAWKDLRDRFSQGDLVRIAELQNEISSLKQNSMSVNDYYTEIKTLWEELEHYRPIPQCRCTVHCRCEAIEQVKLFREQDNAIRFLLGLNENFGVIKSQILMSNPLPSIAKVVSLAMQHERQSDFEESDESKVIVNVAEGRKSYGRGKMPNSSYSGNSSYYGYKGAGKFCTYCKKPGHIIDICYKLHGYPNTSNTKFASNSTTHVNNVSGGSGGYDTEDDQGDDSIQIKESEEPFTADQYKRIVSIIQQVAGSSKKVAETGQVAVNHVIRTTNHNSGTTGHGGAFPEEDWFG